MMTFEQVMTEMPGHKVFEFLSDPHPVDWHELFLLCAWIRPKLIENNQIGEAIIESGVLESLSQVKQRIKDKSLKWNGKLVDNHTASAIFFDPGWAVISIGRRNHTMIINNPVLEVMEVARET